MKTLIDKNGKTIEASTIVLLDGKLFRRVASISMGKKTVNLHGVFSSRITEKQIPLDRIVEDDEKFMEQWRKSETYQSM